MGSLGNFEFAFLNFIQNNIANSFLDNIMLFFTYIGNAGFIWIAIAILLFLIPKQRKVGVEIALALLFGVIIGNLIMKPLFARIRPCDINTAVNLLIDRPTDFSFPSGHALSSFAAATIIYLNNKKWGLGAIVVAFLIAFSRLYLYVHFPTDILAGIIFGVAIAIIVHKFVAIYLIEKNSMYVEKYKMSNFSRKRSK